MKIVKLTNPETSTVIALHYDSLDKKGAEVTIYQNDQYAGVYSLETANKGITNAKSKNWPVSETEK